MGSPEVQVLVVVQEAILAGAISRALSDAGFGAHWAACGQGALDMAAHQRYAGFIVELVLPDMLGMHLVHSLRTSGQCAPVLLLGGRSVPQVVAGRMDPSLAALPKPFAMADLVSRIRAMVTDSFPHRPPPLRKPSPPPPPRPRLVYQRLEVDPETRAVSCDGRSVSLTDREFAVLDCLMRHPEEVVTKAELSKAVWGSENGVRSNVLEVYINFLRRKIDQGFDRKLLHTVRGAGYVLRSET